jgi:hypothetical protein
LPSSSPAKESYAGHHQTSRSTNGERNITALPTPEKSSQQDILIQDGTVS